MEDITHSHEWIIPIQEDTEEIILWCRNCLATKDSDGGIIE